MNPGKNFTGSKNQRQASIADALGAVAKIREGIPSAFVFKHGNLLVKMVRPSGQDTQKPHTRDEIYVIARGSGWFVNGSERHPFQAGDLLFAPAGVRAPLRGIHRRFLRLGDVLRSRGRRSRLNRLPQMEFDPGSG